MTLFKSLNGYVVIRLGLYRIWLTRWNIQLFWGIPEYSEDIFK